MKDQIIIDLELRDKECAFFALYAGLRMYYEKKKNTGSPNEFSIAAAEAYSILSDLKESHPDEFLSAQMEYDRVYGCEDFSSN